MMDSTTLKPLLVTYLPSLLGNWYEERCEPESKFNKFYNERKFATDSYSKRTVSEVMANTLSCRINFKRPLRIGSISSPERRKKIGLSLSRCRSLKNLRNNREIRWSSPFLSKKVSLKRIPSRWTIIETST
jgi:hypothetical protein